MNQFSKRLRELRLSRGLLQRELAEIAGIQIRSYQLYEQGKTEPSIKVLIKFADALNVSLDYLVGRDFDPSIYQVPVVGAGVDSLAIPVVAPQTDPQEHPND